MLRHVGTVIPGTKGLIHVGRHVLTDSRSRRHDCITTNTDLRVDESLLLVVTRHGVVDSQPAPRSASRAEDGTVLVPLVGGVEAPEDDGLTSPAVGVRRTRPELLVHGDLADEIATSRLTASPRCGIAIILAALPLAAGAIKVRATSAILGATTVLLALVLDIRVLNSHAQDAGPLNGRERNVDVLTRAEVAVAVRTRVTASATVNATLVGVHVSLIAIGVELLRACQASDALPAVVLQTRLGDGDLDEASELRSRRELGVLVKLKCGAHLHEEALVIASRKVKSLVHVRCVALPSPGDSLCAGRGGAVERAGVLVKEDILTEDIRAVIAVGVLVEVRE
jgi:hypothetical protein